VVEAFYHAVESVYARLFFGKKREEVDLEDLAVGCLFVQVAGPVALIAVLIGFACGRIIR
jgi:hypothetical protein